MAESSRFWTTNGTGDGPAGGYTAQQFYDFLRKLLITDQSASQGVIFGEANQLAATGSASPIAVNTGSAIVYGFFYENTVSVNLTVTTPVVGTTGGRVNLKADWTAQTVRLVANRNTDGVSTPPGLTQTPGSVYEMPLYTFTITTGGVITLTDVRKYIAVGTQLQANAVDTAAIQANAVTDAKLRTSAGMSVIGRGAATTGDVADITAASDNTVLRRSGTSLGFGQLINASLADRPALSVLGRSLNSSGPAGDISSTGDYQVLRRVGTNLGWGEIDPELIQNDIWTCYWRQGGSTTHWGTAGSNDYQVDTLKPVIFVGAKSVTIASATYENTVVITFPTAGYTYSYNPIVLMSIAGISGTITDLTAVYLTITAISPTSVTIKAHRTDDPSSALTVTIDWMSIGM